MKICTCERCRYIFPSPVIPCRCPDCGRRGVRIASPEEIRQYKRFKEIIRMEIRMGVIPG